MNAMQTRGSWASLWPTPGINKKHRSFSNDVTDDVAVQGREL